MKRKSGFLFPVISNSSIYGFGVDIPYYWALAPDYDLTFSYDELDRPIGTAAGDEALLKPISMQYDALGRRTSLTDGSGAGIPTTFEYDPSMREI